MQKKRIIVLALAALIAAGGVWAGENAAKTASVPPEQYRQSIPFQRPAAYVRQKDMPAELGAVFADPATLPEGPYMGYDMSGRLVSVSYMVTLSDLDAHRDFRDLGAKISGISVDHTDVVYNPGHAGFDHPHYIISEWLVGRSAQLALDQKNDR